MNAPSAPRGASPCVNICRMDPVSGWCEGCQRTLDEIAAWSLLDDDEREAVLRSLDGRRAALASAARHKV